MQLHDIVCNNIMKIWLNILCNIKTLLLLWMFEGFAYILMQTDLREQRNPEYPLQYSFRQKLLVTVLYRVLYTMMALHVECFTQSYLARWKI